MLCQTTGIYIIRIFFRYNFSFSPNYKLYIIHFIYYFQKNSAGDNSDSSGFRSGSASNEETLLYLDKARSDPLDRRVRGHGRDGALFTGLPVVVGIPPGVGTDQSQRPTRNERFLRKLFSSGPSWLQFRPRWLSLA